MPNAEEESGQLLLKVFAQFWDAKDANWM